MQYPAPGEYNPYFESYIGMAGNIDFSEANVLHTRIIEDFLLDIPEEKHDHAYEPGKWTVRQVLQHIIDMERVMAFRAVMIVRMGGDVSLSPVDENRFAEHADVSLRSFDSLYREFVALRQANSFFFNSLTEPESRITGLVSGHATTARALGYIILGHALYHKRILEERYL
jgi:DinB superfamily